MADDSTVVPFTTDREAGDGAEEPLRLAADDLVKVYKGRRVVRGVSVEIRQGAIVGLLGPNGAGKTTTFYMIVALIRPHSAQLTLGEDHIPDFPIYLPPQQPISHLP